MEKMHLKNGKVIFPNKLRISKKINIGIVGSGKIAGEYAKVIRSFKHNLVTIVSKSLSPKAKKLIKKYNIKKHYFDFETALQDSKNVDGWIICSSWNTLLKNFKSSIKHKKAVLLEKSMPISSYNLKKISSTLTANQKKNFLVAYNRNYYDFLPLLVKKLKKTKPDMISMVLPDPFSQILKKQGPSIKKNLIKYVTSHWISLIYKILYVLNLFTPEEEI